MPNQFDDAGNQLFQVFGDESGYLDFLTWDAAKQTFGATNVEILTGTTGRQIIRVYEAA